MQHLTTTQINAVATLLAAKAYVQTITPIVQAYQTKVLQENEFFHEWKDYKARMGMKEGDKIRITDTKDVSGMSEADILEYVRLLSHTLMSNNYYQTVHY